MFTQDEELSLKFNEGQRRSLKFNEGQRRSTFLVKHIHKELLEVAVIRNFHHALNPCGSVV